MVSNVESFTCLWLDKYVNTTEDNIDTQEELRQIINDLRTFDNSDACEQYIRQVTQEKIVLIVSGGLGRQIVPRLHDLSQFSSCYVFCQDKKANEEWAKKYDKINGVFVQRNHLITQITEDQINRTKTEDGASVSVISSKSPNLQARNATFMWFQLFIEVLLRMHHKSSDRKELIDICKKSYAGNHKQMEIINEFEQKYNAEKAIWWYTRDSCFYRMMNKALRVQKYDTLFAFRFFITDIAKQLKHEYENFIRTNVNRSIIRVYRGQLISIEELELMKNNIGEFLSMNSFLSTSRNRSTALEFTRISRRRDNMRAILFEIEIDPRLRTKAFAAVDQISYFEQENEILIMLGALFCIRKVIEDEQDNIWVVHVSLASEDDYHLKEIFSHMKGKIGDDTNLDSLGKLLLRMDENEQARKCYRRMLEETQLAVGDAQLGLGWASLRCKNYDESLEHFEESLLIRQRILGENHPSVGESYSFLGEVYRIEHKYEKALIDLTKAMKIQENSLPADSLDLAATYDTIANTYISLEKYDIALEYFNKTLKIRQAKLPSDHPQIAAIYNNIGWLYECEENYTKALDCYQKALEISRKTLPPTHHHVTGTEKSIRTLKKKMKQYN
ncbi:unnamed protein product [Rotaria sp. Silwood2]|nr:unnamed protein product [Rotaria sp. Silwood2]CAF2986098.1 unnamed protein product [Rotaria sp. Silwood2]CAF4025662.1 unnamed protein product [Rotaria sp. Silwood2]CAF4061624.1 unnamed protein product [Rotaria sp. Silwood2]